MFKRDRNSVSPGSYGTNSFPSSPSSGQEGQNGAILFTQPAATFTCMDFTPTTLMDHPSSMNSPSYSNSSGTSLFTSSAANFTSAPLGFHGNAAKQEFGDVSMVVGQSSAQMLAPTAPFHNQSAVVFKGGSQSPNPSTNSQSGDRVVFANQSRSPRSIFVQSDIKSGSTSSKVNKRMSEGFGEQPVFDGAAVGLELATSLHKLEQQQSPTDPRSQFSYSRTSSTGSVHAFSCSSASSAQNTDDEDSDGTTKAAQCYKDRRREAHTAAEQKRRDAIKKGYDELQMIVPTCANMETLGSQKLSKATVLQKSIDYIEYLVEQKRKQENDLEKLRKDVMGLKIMKANYEHIVKAHQSTPQAGLNQVPDEVKFQVFQGIMDKLFQSFNASISVANFAELSGCVFTWLEEHCKPQSLQETTLAILRQLNTQL